MTSSIACILGAGYSFIAGLPLARDLFTPFWGLAKSEASLKRLAVVKEHYDDWQLRHPQDYPEQYMGQIFSGALKGSPPKWEWVVEYVSASIASAGAPGGSHNTNPRYSNRVNRPLLLDTYRSFWRTLTDVSCDISVLTTNYDILVERTLRHKPMRRPASPGCFYGGLPRPQWLKGAAQPFSRWSPERLIEMTGSVPIYKLHGSLNWSLRGSDIVTYQDMRAAFRNGGEAAIIPPIPEKSVPFWLAAIWREGLVALRRSETWIVCGYSTPTYDTEVERLLREGSADRELKIVVLDPQSTSVARRWQAMAPQAQILALPGLPECNVALASALRL